MKLVGILNVTPDSFSDGGQFDSAEAALAQARQLFTDGAEIVDVGAESTRPGAVSVALEEEWGRVHGFFKALVDGEWLMVDGERKTIKDFSLDTRNPATAQKFLELGGRIINDVSGFQDPRMIELVAKHGCGVWVSHFPGSTIDEVHAEKIGSTNQVRDELLTRAKQMIEQGIDRSKIVLDPGLGFGKTPELNWELLEFAALVPDWPVMIGHSKKRFLGEERMVKLVNVKAAQTAQAAGAKYLRVHNPAWY